MRDNKVKLRKEIGYHLEDESEFVQDEIFKFNYLGGEIGSEDISSIQMQTTLYMTKKYSGNVRSLS